MGKGIVSGCSHVAWVSGEVAMDLMVLAGSEQVDARVEVEYVTCLVEDARIQLDILVGLTS